MKVAVLCDPDEKVLASTLKGFESKYGYRPETETDLRKVYDRKDVDVVSVATPNHWHSLATIWACQAGKDVYVEKPGSHNIFEGRKMVEAAKKYDRVVQHGVQLRSSEAVREAVDHLRNGLIGKVYMARGLVFRQRPSIGHAKDPDTVPPGLNWDIWQGPVTSRAFSKRLVHYNWHWHWDYGNGDVGNQGVHETDMCLWGLGLDTFPDEITAMGGKFLWDDDKETPDVLTSSYFFKDRNQMIEFEVRPWATNTENGAGVGNIFYGSDGYLVIKGYNTYESFLGKDGKPGPKNKDGDPVAKHFANFIDAVRNRDAKRPARPGPDGAHKLGPRASRKHRIPPQSPPQVRPGEGNFRQRQRGRFDAHAALSRALRRARSGLRHGPRRNDRAGFARPEVLRNPRGRRRIGSLRAIREKCTHGFLGRSRMPSRAHHHR